jgi:hypothetical protein
MNPKKPRPIALKAVVASAAHAINESLCILLSAESTCSEFDAASAKIQAQAAGLLLVTDKRAILIMPAKKKRR